MNFNYFKLIKAHVTIRLKYRKQIATCKNVIRTGRALEQELVVKPVPAKVIK